MEHNVTGVPRTVGYSSPGGWESEGPQMGGRGSSEWMSTYLASSGVPEPHLAVLAFWGQGTGKRSP